MNTKDDLCPICGAALLTEIGLSGRVQFVACPTCGEYGLTDEALWALQTLQAEDKAKISACLREQNIRGDDPVALFREHHPDRHLEFPVRTVQEIISTFPPTVSDRLDRALKNLHKCSNTLKALIR